MPDTETLRWMPRYHFTIHGNGFPGDPNGAFWHDGRYHLMYLVSRAKDQYSWGHVSSTDLIHWESHPDAIGPAPMQVGGCYSGGGFIDDDGTAYLSYWMLWGALGLGIAQSRAPFDEWELCLHNPVVKSTEFGWTKDAEGRIYGSADPSNIWKKDGKYYFLAGNLLALDKFGRSADAPEELRGDRAYLFESDDLVQWKYLHPFYQRNTRSSRAEGWTDPDEDCMCPSFLPLPKSPDGGALSDKHLLLFISHIRGCQYYIGRYADDRFIPESHGRMSWQDKSYFAPEALVDGKGRQIMWTWLLDNPENDLERAGWSGVYGLPRSLWLREDGTLGIAPVEEMKQLRGKKIDFDVPAMTLGKKMPLVGFDTTCCEVELTLPFESAGGVRLLVQSSPDGACKTTIRYDAESGELVVDAAMNDTEKHFPEHVDVERAPLPLAQGEALALRVFIDGPVVEVFANGRQAITRRVYPAAENRNIFLVSQTGAGIGSLAAYEMKEIQNP